MKIFVTGISGSDATGYLKETQAMAKKHKKDFNIYSVGERLIKYFNEINQLNYDPEQILDCPETTRKLAMGAVYEKILREMVKDKNTIIDTHACFLWNGFENATNWHYIKEIEPDIYVTIIDYEGRIKERLEKNKQWKKRNLSYNEILRWQDVEVMTTAMIAQSRDKPHFIIPRELSQTTLFNLMFRPELPRAYASFPMSHISDPKIIKRIDDFVIKLQQYFTVITPRSVELSKEFNRVQAEQTVERDLDWYIGEVDYIINFMPKKVFSQGGSSEIQRGHDSCKTVFAILPHGYGPFEMIQCDKIFKSEAELFKYLDDNKFKKIKDLKL